MEEEKYSRDEMLSFARYIWAKPMSDYSKGLTHYFEEWKEIQLSKQKNKDNMVDQQECSCEL